MPLVLTRIFLFCYNRPGQNLPNDWAILELQGDLKSHSESLFDGQFIGDLHFNKAGVPILIIGHHLMFGKEVAMDKPYAVLEKKVPDKTGSEYVVKAIVRRKLLFKTRPKPIVSQ